MSKEIEITVKGMDCAGCARNVQSALEKVDGVESAEVFLSAEKARLVTGPEAPAINTIKKAVKDIGYYIPEVGQDKSGSEDIARKSFRLFGLVFGGILFIIVGGEWLGLFQTVTDLVPFWTGALFVLITGYPVFKQVVAAAFNKLVTPHALMALGATAALIAGQWITAAVVVFFMRMGDYIESYTTDKARESVRSLTEFAPQKATIIQDDIEMEVPVSRVMRGATVLVRPGEKIPVDGTVLEGSATVDQSTITGESMPVEVKAESKVFASTIAVGGRLLIRAEAVGEDSTFGKIIRMVEEAEAQKGDVQRFADKFSGYYLPVVAGIAGLTYLFSGDLMSTVAVMVVACACAFALATPVALLASIGSKAKQGLLIKGGKYIEVLEQADVLLIDKTGTLTFGKPKITDVITLNGCSEGELLRLAASAEYYSQHPFAKAVIRAADEKFIALKKPDNFEELTGNGVKAEVNEQTVTVGNERLAETDGAITPQIEALKKEGKTVITVQQNNTLIGLLAAGDAERKEVKEVIKNLRAFNFRNIELLTGDNKQTADALARRLNIDYRAELLPEEKIEIVKKYQSEGRTVVMVGDGVNDAPALAQADVGIAMGTTGTDAAIETADITLMRDDWNLIFELFKTAKRTMKVIKWNFGFTTIYNIAGLTLAAFGILPPILAAAAQSIPDVGILLNSSRLLRK